MRELAEIIVLIKGGGEVGSGIAHLLHHRHFRVCLTEIDQPLAVSRGTTFSEAVFDGTKTIEGVTAVLVPPSAEDIHQVWEKGNISVIIDPHSAIKKQLEPDVLVDAIMAKRNIGTKISDALLVIGIGPGFYAGRDVDIVVESNNSDNLGRVILDGEAEKNNGIPVSVGGLTRERVIWAPQAGVFTSNLEISDSVVAEQAIGWVDDLPLKAPLSGMLRGLIRSGVRVTRGTKLIEVDPVNDKDICHLITSKMCTIGEGVLQAIMAKFKAEA